MLEAMDSQSFVAIAQNKIGTHPLQKLIMQPLTSQEINHLDLCISGNVVSLALNQFSTHVL